MLNNIIKYLLVNLIFYSLAVEFLTELMQNYKKNIIDIVGSRITLLATCNRFCQTTLDISVYYSTSEVLNFIEAKPKREYKDYKSLNNAKSCSDLQAINRQAHNLRVYSSCLPLRYVDGSEVSN